MIILCLVLEENKDVDVATAKHEEEEEAVLTSKMDIEFVVA
jgi:hypothetical protein